MRLWHATAVTLLLLLAAPAVLACSCSNSTPIQKSSPRYTAPGRAVFTARIVQLIGKIYVFDGKRASSLAMAVVHQQYWGLPWYWPKVVLLDGSYPCDTAMTEGEEYLVAGREERYGVVSVNLCSRTQPLRTAQLDLRTLDGTHCAAPGGTILGHVHGDWDDERHDYQPVRVHSITFTDLEGSRYPAGVDADGIYELRNLPAVPYVPVSLLDDHRFLESGYGIYDLGPIDFVHEGVCKERDLTVREYQVTGLLLPGIRRSVEVEMLSVAPGSVPARAFSIEPDGRFYFSGLAPGEYTLSVVATIGAAKQRIFYPGVPDRAKAARIAVSEAQAGRSYDFDPGVLPVVPIPLVMDPAPGAEKYEWRFQLVADGKVISSSWADGTNVGLVYGLRGKSYDVAVFGNPKDPLKDGYCVSEPVPLVAAAGMAPVHVSTSCAPADR